LAGPHYAGDGYKAWWGSFIRGDRPKVDRSARPIRFIDLFSSVGGLSLGAMDAMTSLGLRGVPLLCSDVDEGALRVYHRNLRPRQVIPESVASLVSFQVIGSGDAARFAYEPSLADGRLESLIGTVDLILAGPPCQGHSSLNNHSRHDDPKNLLYLTVPAMAVALGARHIVIENVPTVVADKNGVVQTTLALLRGNGYRITSGVLGADKMGWAQARKRYFLIASKDTFPLDLGVLKESLAREPAPVTWMLDDLKDRPLDDADPMFSVPRLSAENQMRVDWLFEDGESRHTLLDAIRPDCHKNGTTYGNTYGRMYADRPAPTITGGFLTPGRGRFLHPERPRVLTPREAARVQGFPDWFEFLASDNEPPSRAQLSTWIGNAVPSILGYVATLSALGGEIAASASQEHELSAHAS
jgi:DNA (cytosine-5)-methyltransferase 1